MNPALFDTSPEAERVLVELMRQTPVWHRLELVAEMNEAVRLLILSGLHTHAPRPRSCAGGWPTSCSAPSWPPAPTGRCPLNGRTRHDSTRQWCDAIAVRDVIAVLRVQGARLDERYLAAWAAQLGVEDLLAKAMAEAKHGQ